MVIETEHKKLLELMRLLPDHMPYFKLLLNIERRILVLNQRLKLENFHLLTLLDQKELPKHAIEA